MNPAEFGALANVERHHWFYHGKREIVRHWVRALVSLRPEDVLVDVGAGTGQLVLEFSDTCNAIGVEPHPHGVAIAGRKAICLLQGSVTALPVASDAATVVTALDVLEHVEDDAGALAELVRITRPGGIIIIHVPAFQLLWSDWDESLGHKRRYTKPSLLALVNRADLRVQRCTYVNTVAFGPVLGYRWVRTWLGARRRLEDRVPSAWLNRILFTLFVAPACWRWLSPPFGISILCIVQKQVADRRPTRAAPGSLVGEMVHSG